MPTRRVIIDTDPGIDDAQAVLFAFLCGHLQVDALTTVFGNVPVDTAARNALRLIELADRTDVPVYVGAAEPLVRRRLRFAPMVHGEDGLGNVEWPLPARRPAPGYAAVELARRVLAAPGEIAVLTLGPLTNIALALRLEPRFAGAVQEIIYMGGTILGPGNVTAVATANMLNDPEAAKVVLHSGIPLTMVGLDVTRRVRITPQRRDGIRAAGTEIGEFIYRITGFYADAYLREGVAGFPVHDLVVMAYALRPDLFETKRLAVDIETEGAVTAGMTVADFRPFTDAPANVTVCLGADADGILDWYERVVTAGAAAARRGDPGDAGGHG